MKQVKPDRLSALRQRLKRGSFEFGALLEGVSTIDDENRAIPEIRLPQPELETLPERPNGARVEEVESLVETVLREDEPQGSLPLLESPLGQPHRGETQEERLRAALDSLGCRFLTQMGALRAALADGDVEESGFQLAHLNHVVELLRDIDAEGDIARQLGTMAAPPPGRTWPAPCWTIVEFAESPISGLLPPKAGEAFVRDTLYAAWGVTFEA